MIRNKNILITGGNSGPFGERTSTSNFSFPKAEAIAIPQGLHPKQERLANFLLTLNINLMIKEIYGTMYYFCDWVFIFHPTLVMRVD